MPVVEEFHFSALRNKFIALTLLWLVLSNQWDAFHLTLGFVTICVTLFIQEMLFPAPRSPFRNLKFFKFLFFLPWFFLEILKANFHVCFLALHPRMKRLIKPRMLQFQSDDFGREGEELLLAHAITLTPGTLTVDVYGAERSAARIFTVHALSDPAAEGIPEPIRGEIAKLFRVVHEGEVDL